MDNTESVAPMLPSGKSMIEDIETCSRNDPVIKFGEVVQARVKAMSISGYTTDADQQYPIWNLSKPATETFDNRTGPPLCEVLDVQLLTLVKKMSLKSSTTTGTANKLQISTEGTTDSDFLRLKKLSDGCEKAQGLLELLEPELKTLKAETMEFKLDRIADDSDLSESYNIN